MNIPKFPTMLRKMWSGGEVQKWIDENIEPLFDGDYECRAHQCRRQAAEMRARIERLEDDLEREQGVREDAQRQLLELEAQQGAVTVMRFTHEGREFVVSGWAGPLIAEWRTVAETQRHDWNVWVRTMVASDDEFELFQVEMQRGVQQFRVGPEWDDREEAERYAEMLRRALAERGSGNG